MSKAQGKSVLDRGNRKYKEFDGKTGKNAWGSIQEMTIV